MLPIERVIENFSEKGFGPYICVPCSLLKPFINYVIDSPTVNYIKSTSEGEAIGIAAGAFLAGKLPVVMMQNSGLGNAVNPLTSLTNIYDIPMLIIVSLRGAPGIKDEPQHRIMGEITSQLLSLTGVENNYFPDAFDDFIRISNSCYSYINENARPYGLILKKGIFEKYDLKSGENYTITHTTVTNEADISPDNYLKRKDAIAVIIDELPGATPVLSTTGMISRELYTIADAESNFYTVGSMGCTSAIGMGVSLHKKNTIVILDGDGAALMKMGNLATIGHYAPSNLVHIVLDNQTYDSTGGQASAAATVNLCQVAAACGYRSSTNIFSEEFLGETIQVVCQKTGPHFIKVNVQKGHDNDLGRPTITPPQIKERFINFLKGVE